MIKKKCILTDHIQTSACPPKRFLLFFELLKKYFHLFYPRLRNTLPATISFELKICLKPIGQLHIGPARWEWGFSGIQRLSGALNVV